MRQLLLIFTLLLSANIIFAQADSLSNWRQQRVLFNENGQQLDSLTIIENSVQIWVEKDSLRKGELLKIDQYAILNNELFFNKNIQSQYPDSQFFIVKFRVLPFNLSATYTHLDSTEAKLDDRGQIVGITYDPYARNPRSIDVDGLNYNGSFARGISFGNNQNLVLNSSFNLQLAGDIGDGIEVLAAITDENIPLQPEGNTQQLQEFDKIFIQLKKGDNQLIAGDYELRRPNSYFLNYYKKLQGATLSNRSEVLDDFFLNTKGSIAISRGRFARNTIIAIEGNQGPYKLQGANGERFIIALAGTEKVFLDGVLLTRGLEQDYVIDYNRAEVEFTNKRLITKDSRIIIEFEYSDQNYTRSLYAINSELEYDKLKLNLNIYSEQDGKTPTTDRAFTPAEQAAFLAAGDSGGDIFVQPAIDTVESFDEFRVLYRLRDTLVAGQLYEDILEYSIDPDSAIFSASFTQVEQGEGNYVLVPASETGANGRVFRWVAPDTLTGISQGNYISARRLVAPQQKQLFTFGGTYAINEKGTIQAEIGMSNFDSNRFSTLNQQDNTALAGFTSFEQGFELGKKEKGWEIATDLSYEWLQENFNSINPYRPAEFTRDWNYDNTQKATENLGTAAIVLRKKDLGEIGYEFGVFDRDSLYNGTRHATTFQLNQGGWNIDLEGSYLSSETNEETANFFRPRLRLEKTFEQLNSWKLGVYGEKERNERYLNGSDTLQQTSFYYDLYRVYLESPTSDKINLRGQYSQRYDYAPVDTDFINSTIADEFNFTGNWQQSRSSRLNWNFTYRELQIIDKDLTTQDPKATYLGRLDYLLTSWKGALRSNTTYEIGSGQEPKVEFVYLEVNSGEGVYQWKDYNEDGVTQVNEFEVAVFADSANYIRSSVFTDDFVRSNNVSLNQSLRIDPRAIWFQKEGFKKFLTRFSTQSTFRISRKTREDETVQPYNPFQFDVPDTLLVSTTSNIRNSLYFNRSDPKYSLEIGQSDLKNRVILTTGYESRSNAERFFRGRWNINKSISLQLNSTFGTRANDSEFFNNKDYEIDFYRLEPKVTWQPSTKFRTILAYEFLNSKNILPDGGETTMNHDINAEVTFNQSTSTSIRTKLSYVRVDFDGDSNSPVGFAMLQGLQNGQNYLWNVALDRKLTKNIQLRLSYEGRKTGTASIVHVGRAQVAAVF